METVDGPTQPAGSWIDQLQARLDRSSVGPWAVYGLAALSLAGSLRLDPTFLGLHTGQRLPDTAVTVMGWINSSMILIGLYYLVRQLTAVSAVHRSAGNLNLYDWQPMFAFSNLTYRTAVISVLVISCFVAVFPEVLDSPPGLRTKLQSEKHRLLSDARRRIQATLEELHQRIEAADLSSMQRIKDQLGSLLLEEDYLGKLRTWPWPPGLFLRVLGVIGFPILLFILQRTLQEWLGF